MIILKGHGVYRFHPGMGGNVQLRAPPAAAFTPPTEPDFPAFAHDGHGNLDEGEWMMGNHGEMVYNTEHGGFRHGIDAIAFQLGRYFNKHGIRANPIDVINKAINDFNQNHEHQENHSLPPFDSMAWRKIRMGPLQPASGNNRATRTKNGTLITALHNLNPDASPAGKFLESYHWPANKELTDVLTKDLGLSFSDFKSDLPFTKYSYVYANHSSPPGVYSTQNDHPEANIPERYMSHAPEGMYPGKEAIHTWQTMSQLPEIAYYPQLKIKDDELIKPGGTPKTMAKLAHQYIDEALEKGLEHIPNVPITINFGTLGARDMRQVNLREALTDPETREALIKDVAHSPALMYMFGRSNQGTFNKIANFLEERYGLGDEGLSLEDHQEYFTAGSAGKKQGTHVAAKKLMGMARKSGIAENGRSNLGNHQVTEEEAKLMGMPYSDGLKADAARYRTILEAMGAHQSNARGHKIWEDIGEIPDKALPKPEVLNFPQLDPETGQYTIEGLPPHMDAYSHRVEDYAPTTAIETSMGDTSLEQDVAPTESDVLPIAPPSRSAQPQTTIPPPVGATPPPMAAPSVPVMPPRPLPQDFQSLRPSAAHMSPQEFRGLLEAAGRRQTPADAPPDFTEVERRAQQSIADPRQTFLSQFLRGEDSHLGIMDRVMKTLDRIQIEAASLDFTKPPPLNLSKTEIHSINQSMGDWGKIAKAHNVPTDTVKLVKVRYGVKK